MAQFPFATPMPGQPSVPAAPPEPVWRPILKRFLDADPNGLGKATEYINALLPKMKPADRLSWQSFVDEQRQKQAKNFDPKATQEEAFDQPAPQSIPLPPDYDPGAKPVLDKPRTVLDPGGNQPVPQQPLPGTEIRAAPPPDWGIDSILNFMGPIGTLLRAGGQAVEAVAAIPERALKAADEINPAKPLGEQAQAVDKLVEPATETALTMLGAPVVPGAVAVGRGLPGAKLSYEEQRLANNISVAKQKLAHYDEIVKAGYPDPTGMQGSNISHNFISAGAREIGRRAVDPTTGRRTGPVQTFRSIADKRAASLQRDIARDEAALAALQKSEGGFLGTGMSRPILPGTPEASVASRIVSPSSAGATPRPGAQETADSLITQFVDDLQPIKRLEMQAAGQKVDTPNSPYDLARLSRGAGGMATTFARDGTFDYNTLQRTGKGLEEILKPVETNKQLFETYAVAKRSEELRQRGVETGVPEADAQAVLTNNPDMEAPFRELVDYQKEGLRYLKDAGILSDAQYQSMLSANLDYIPFFRLTADTAKGPGRSLKVRNPVYRIKGSDAPIASPLESVIKNTHLYITMAERNRALRAMKELPNSHDFMERVQSPTHAVEVSEPEIRRFLDEHNLDPDLAEPLTIFRKGAHKLAPDEIALWENGKREVYRVDPTVAEAVQGMDAPTMEWWKTLLAAPARMLRAGVTLSPEYYIRNVLTKDQLAGFAQAKKGYVPVYDMMKGMFEAAKRGPEFQKWARGGGLQSALIAMDRNYSSADMMKLAKDRTWLQKGLNVITHPVQMLRLVNEAMDTGTRLGAFMRANKGSMDPEQIRRSALEARNVTQDFSRVGAKIKGINSLSAFLNGQIQGMSRELETIGGALRKPTSKDAMKTLARVTGAITVPSVLLWWANRGDPRWEEAQDWEKDAYWFILPEDKEAPPYKVAKPFGYGLMFGSLVERSLSSMYDNNPRAFENFGSAVLNIAAPPMLPTFAIPFIEGQTNFDLFMKGPVIPERLENEPAAEQYTGSTSEIAKLIGKGVASIPGMDDSNFASPMVIENFARDWGGDIGRDALKLTNPLLRSKDAPPPVAPDWGSSPITRAFMSRYPAVNSQPMDDVFQIMSRVRKGLTPDPAGTLATAEGNLRNGYKQIRAIEADPDMDPDAKRAAVNRIFLQMRGEASFSLRKWRADQIDDRTRTKDDVGDTQAAGDLDKWKTANKKYKGISDEEAPLFMELEKRGIKVDRRWGIETLKRKLQETQKPSYGGTQ